MSLFGSLKASVFSCSHDNLLKSWSMTTGRLDQTFIGSERAIYTIHLSPFNPSLLFSGGYDCAIRVWDIKTAACTHTLKGHNDSIFSLLLLPDGRLVSGSSDKTIKVWSLKSKGASKCEATLTGHLGGVLSLVWVGGLGCFVSASIDHTIKVWNAKRAIDPACLSEDMQVLTERGFLAVRDVLSCIRRHGQLRVAGFNATAQTLEYWPITAANVIDRVGEQRLVRFRNGHRHPRVDLLVTADHDMFVSEGKRSSGAVNGSDRLVGRTETDAMKDHRGSRSPTKTKASQLLNRPATHRTKFFASAPNGVSRPEVAAAGLPFVAALGLVRPTDSAAQAADRIDAFLELYGYWLGDGTLYGVAGAVIWIVRRKKDWEYLMALFRRLEDVLPVTDVNGREQFDCIPMGKGQHFVRVESEPQSDAAATGGPPLRHFSVYSPAWWTYFAEQYGHKYRGEKARQAVLSGAARRGSGVPRSRYPERRDGEVEVDEDEAEEPTILDDDDGSADNNAENDDDDETDDDDNDVGIIQQPPALSSSSSSSPSSMSSSSTASRPSSPQPPDADGSNSSWFYWWVHRLSARQLKLMLDGLLVADGSKRRPRGDWPRSALGATLFTSSARFRDEIVHVAMDAGFSTYFWQDSPKGKVRHPILCRAAPPMARYDQWRIRISADVRSAERTLRTAQHVREFRTKARVWCVTLPAHTDQLIVARRVREWHPDGMASSASQPVIVGNCRDEFKCEMTMIGHTLPVSSLVLLDDNRIVSASHDKTIRVWNITSLVTPPAAAQSPSSSSSPVPAPHPHRKPKCELTITAHAAPIQAITLLSSSHLVSCSRDLTIKVWHLSSLTSPPLLTLQGHTKDINSLSVMADGRLVSASSDCTIRVWTIDLNNGTGHCDQSFNNIGPEGRGFVVYAVCSFRWGMEEVGLKRSSSRGNVSQLMAGAAPSPSAASLPPASSPLAANPSLAFAASTPGLPSVPVNPSESAAALVRSRGKSRPSASTGAVGVKVDAPSAAALEARRMEKLKRAGELERLRQLEEARMLEESELGDEEEARRFSSILSLRKDSEMSETVSATVSKYRNAHHLNYHDILNDGWYDDGGIIPGVNSAKVGRERGGGRWEGDVVIFDSATDSALSDLIDMAKKLVRQQDTVKGRVQILAQLVSNKLGGLPNDVVGAWERVMKKALRYKQQRLASLSAAEHAAVDPRMLLPIGALLGGAGLTRHRACLFKYLCDLTVQNPEEWCWPVDEVPISPGIEDDRGEGGVEGGKREKGEGQGREEHPVVMRLSRFLDDASLPEKGGGGVAGFEDEKGEEAAIVEDRERHRLGGLRRSSDSEAGEDKAGDTAAAVIRHHGATPDELAIHCRLIRGQYQYYVPRSRKHKKDSLASPLSPPNSHSPNPPNATTAGGSSGAWDDDERGRERIGGYHGWNVVIINGEHYVVDLIYQASMLYHESSREAMHYNRGRLGHPKQTGLTNLPVRDVREIEWGELTNITNMKDGGFGRVEKAKWRGLDVVIKTPLTADQYVIRTFIEEARVLNTLSHPNIVQLIGVCSAKKAIIIEYINGGDVHQWVKQKKHTASITLKQRLDVLIQCFPEVDTRVLTDTGFLFLDQIEARLAANERVLYACYDKAKKALVYKPGTLHLHPAPSHLVDFTAADELRRWTTGSGPYGDIREDDDPVKDGRCRHLSLRVTPNHKMFVQTGNLDAAGTICWRRGTGSRLHPHRVEEAQDISQCGCRRDCGHLQTGVRMLACAQAGLQTSSTAERDHWKAVLGLNDDQFLVFLELFGFWLGDGTMQYYRDGAGYDAVAFHQVKETDRDWLMATLDKLGLLQRRLEDGREVVYTIDSGRSCFFLIRDPVWFALFDEEFGIKYKNSQYDDEEEEDRPTKSVKWFPYWVVMLKADEMRVVIRGLWRADGGWKRQQKVIYTSGVAFRDQLVQALLHCGYSAWAKIAHKRGAICGYSYKDQRVDDNVYSVKTFNQWSPDKQADYEPKVATQDGWRVTWTLPTSVPGKMSCWPSLISRDICRVPYSPERDGRIWCVTVEHDDHLIFAQRAHRDHFHIVTKQSRPIIIGQSALAMQYLHGCEPPIVHRDLKTLNLLIQNIGEKRVIKVCFPRADHEVLTDRGFMGHAEIKRALQRGGVAVDGSDILVACPVRRRRIDPLDQLAIEYVKLSRCRLIEDRANQLVSFRRSAAAKTAAATRGSGKRDRPVQSDDIDLLLTPEHQLPVRIGADKGVPSSSNPPVMLTAGDVVNVQKRAGRCCPSRPAACIAFIHHAQHGVADPTPATPLPFAVALGLCTEDEVDAFTELYGYWLAEGALSGIAAIVTFTTYNDADTTYLDSLFSRLPLRRLPFGSLNDECGYKRRDFDRRDEADELKKEEDDDDEDDEDDGFIQPKGENDVDVEEDCAAVEWETVEWEKGGRRVKRCSYHIYHPQWWQYFAEQYGHHYWGGRAREAAEAGWRRRGGPRPAARYPLFWDADMNDGRTVKEARMDWSPRRPADISQSESRPPVSHLPPVQLDDTDAVSADRPIRLSCHQVRTSPSGDPVRTPSEPSGAWPLESNPLKAESSRQLPRPLAGEPLPPPSEAIRRAKWMWWWVWSRLDARRLRLLLRGLRVAHGNQRAELNAWDAERTSKAKAMRKGQPTKARQMEERLQDSAEQGWQLVSGVIATPSARCRDEYQHVALRAGYTAVAFLERRKERSRDDSRGCSSQLWYVLYKGQHNAAVRSRRSLSVQSREAQQATKEVGIKQYETPVPVWCLNVPTVDHLLIVRRVTRWGKGESVEEASLPTVVGNCDFGLARNQKTDDGISTQHKDMGTPAFQSPEQWRDDEEERLTEKTDVYSFGGIILEVLTDRIPWHEEKSKYAIYQHVVVEKKGPPISAGGLGGGFVLPQMLIDLIRWCQTFEPEKRPSFPEILRVLREVDDSLPPDG